MSRSSKRYLALAALLLAPAWVQADPYQSHYHFGVVPQFEQRKLQETWKPILEELERRTQARYAMIGTAKIPSFEISFGQGEYDFAYMNPYHVLRAHDSQGYIPLVRDGKRKLRGILVVRKDSEIKQVKDLAGAKIAFPAPNALGASLLLRADLQRRFGIRFTPYYVQTHSSVYLHVVSALTQAGGGVESTLAEQPAAIQKDLRILYTTREMAPHPVVAHPRVPKALRLAVQQAFLDMGKSEHGRALLAKIPMIAPVAASIDDYRELAEWGLDELYETP